MDRVRLAELTEQEQELAWQEGKVNAGSVPRDYYDSLVEASLRKAKLVEGKKYDQGKIRPTLIPAQVYTALLGHAYYRERQVLATELDLVAESLVHMDYLTALVDVQDLLCPNPHPDSRLHGLDQIVAVLEFGAKKYGRDNWQGVSPERYVEAAWRHYLAFCNGETLDSESGLPHLAHLGCCLVFLVYSSVT